MSALGTISAFSLVSTRPSATGVLLLHHNFAQVVIVYSGILALWGLLLYALGRPPGGNYLGALVLNEGVVIVQGIFGIILAVQGHRPASNLHFLYGLVSLLVLPFAYSYSARGTQRQDSLIFGLAGLFLVGIALRATTTA